MLNDRIKMHLERPAVPDYVAGEYGPWTLGKVHDALEQAEIFEWGYATGPQWEPNYWVLRDREGIPWMSTNRLERESHAVHVASARGTVVACGVGLGLFVYNVAQKSNVERVFAVDVSEHVIEMLERCAVDCRWPNWYKVQFIHKDAMQLTRTDLSRHGCQNEPDFLYVDVWPVLGHPDVVTDTQTVVRNVRAKSVGFWGQELELIRWAMREQELDPNQLNLDHFDAWCLHLDMVMQVRSLDYLRFALVVAINQHGKTNYPRIRQRSRSDGAI